MIARLNHDTDEQWAALVYLAEHPGLTLQQLADVIGKNLATVKSWCHRGAWRARLSLAAPPADAAPVPVDTNTAMTFFQLRSLVDANLAVWRADQKRFPGAEPPPGLAALLGILLRSEELQKKLERESQNEPVDDAPDYSALTDLQFNAFAYCFHVAKRQAPQLDDATFLRLVNAGDNGETLSKFRDQGAA